MSGPRVHLYTICWDEADMLGFFFRHYEPWVDRFVVYDDGSTDGSRDILATHPKTELRRFERTTADSFCLSHQALQDEVWKESRGQADWVVVTAIDEHLHVRGRTMSDYLAEQRRCGVTILPALGFDMNHPHMPADQGCLIDSVTRGRARIAFNKLSIFNPDAVSETGFAAGRHRAAPVGALRLPVRNELMLWHYKHLGFDRTAAREAQQAARLGETDVRLDLAQHYRWSKDKFRAFWSQMERESVDLSVDGFVPDKECVGPLWWSERKNIHRVDEARVSITGKVPTVSVLVKSFNHAPYVRQCIDSVFSQTFQDFEIVVTDDASTDATATILKGYSDPRMNLAVNSRNLGISGAMNATIARARGKYLAILNSDDWALPERLERQVAFLDANPHVGLVFGLPRPVGESGELASAFDDFHEPLRFADFSRRTWLRHFFFKYNSLCAPTAMIRREAFEVGHYDRRLTNLQDFDMWIRMLLAGHNIHVLAEEVTAFRIRDGQANMSAPRSDTRIRDRFEAGRVLRRFLSMDEDDFDRVFGDDAEDTTGRRVSERIARLALWNGSPAHRLFGLETLYEAAEDDDAFDQLRDLTGEVDVFGSLQTSIEADSETELPGRRARAASKTHRIWTTARQRKWWPVKV